MSSNTYVVYREAMIGFPHLTRKAIWPVPDFEPRLALHIMGSLLGAAGRFAFDESKP